MSYRTHGYDKFTRCMHKANLLMYFIDAQKIYWMHGCAIYWCTAVLVHALHMNMPCTALPNSWLVKNFYVF